jgi:unsaturated chondroitin disaccharide hydrolase
MYWNQRRIAARRTLPFAPDTVAAARTGLTVACGKVAALVERQPDSVPLYTRAGRWSHDGPAWTNWCEGFLGGQMWIFAEIAGETTLEVGDVETWRSLAARYTDLVEERQHDDQVHDLGFVLCPTWLRRWEVTGDEAARQVVITGGRTLATRFNADGRFLRSFLAPESTFIDIMMNVGIITLAGLESGDEQLLAVAQQHAATTRKHLVRGDGSVGHEGIFDLATGEFLRQSSQQGWRHDSSWARGLAWSLYGFTSLYALTGDPHWLATAELNADYWIEHTSSDPVPPNDFDEPDPVRRWESSAAACAAGGLIMLARLVESDGRADRYHGGAERTIRRLCEPEFLAHEGSWEGTLKHGSYHEGKGLGVDESVMWGDYFFVESLARVVRACVTT